MGEIYTFISLIVRNGDFHLFLRTINSNLSSYPVDGSSSLTLGPCHPEAECCPEQRDAALFGNAFVTVALYSQNGIVDKACQTTLGVKRALAQTH